MIFTDESIDRYNDIEKGLNFSSSNTILHGNLIKP